MLPSSGPLWFRRVRTYATRTGQIPCTTAISLDRCSCLTELGPNSTDDFVGTTAELFGIDPNDMPIALLQVLVPLDVAGPLTLVEPVLHPLVFHPDTPPLPPHVDPRNKSTTRISNVDLGGGFRKSSIDQQQSGARLLRRFRASIHPTEGVEQHPDTPTPRTQ